jgi:hypothetical protein
LLRRKVENRHIYRAARQESTRLANLLNRILPRLQQFRQYPCVCQ